MADERTRRNFLGLAGAAGTALLAGCSSGSSADTPEDGTTTAGGTTPGDTDATGTPTATETPATTDSPSPEAEGSATADEGFSDAFVELYDEVIGSVVAIQVPGGGLGSGFVYDGDHVVTNHHVVTDAGTVEVQYAQGESATAEVVGTDPESDLAVVRAAGRPDYAEPLALHAEEPEVGTRVAAVGSPYGLEGSMSTGIVSGVNRLVPSPNGEFRIPNTIQTDAAVNPGNSGGPLVNLDREVLGVVNSGGGDNIAFAISAALVERVVSGIIENGEYDHPFIGVGLADVTPTVARANDLEQARGLLVTSVADGVPAADVLQGATGTTTVNGFRVPTGGDVILAAGGEPVGSARELLAYLELNASPGEAVEFTILRDGEERTVSVELVAREEFQ
jgi:S1-C subfamily serine protease